MGGRTAVTLFGVVASLMFLPSVAGAYPGEGLSGPGFRIHRGSGSESDVNVCSFAVSPGAAHCDLRVRIDAGARSRLPARAGAVKPDVLGDEGAYDPSYLQSAYDVAAATAADGGGAGQTVAIIDSYNDPNVTSDLAHYRSYFGLPACPAGVVSHTATGCVFEKVNQTGGQTSFPSANSGWATEISLDVEMVSAICSKCQILLVEANSNSDENLGTAVNEAVKLGANAVSNSYGGEEFPSEASESAAYSTTPASQSPPALATAAMGWSSPPPPGTSQPWEGRASPSSRTPAPGMARRPSGAVRVRAAARTNRSPHGSVTPAAPTGLWPMSRPTRIPQPACGCTPYQARGWEIYGGTSVASPIIASFYALAGNALGSGTTPASYLYSAPGALYDVTSGSDGSCSPSYLCTAGVGYDGPTGLGTPGGSPDSLAAFLSTSTTQLPTAPGAPSNLVAKSGNAQVALSWAAPATGTPPFTYSVYESTTSATAGFSLVKSGSALANTSFTATGLTNGKTYYFKVTATNLLEEGPASSVASATPAAGPAVPGAPTGLSAASFFRTVYLSGKAPASNGGSPITSYVIFRATSSGEETQYGTVACTSTTCTARDTGASSSTTTYYYEVAAANVAGQGPRSNEASAKG